MTIEDMRVLLDMPAETHTDAQVVAAYAAYLNGVQPTSPNTEGPLVTLDEAKRHLRILSDDHDQDIASKALAASQIVIDYIDRADVEWTADTVPASIRAAVLLVLGALFEDREGGDPIGRAVTSLLMHYRRPALA